MQHAPTLTSPWYADPGDGTVLHRYMDEQFVDRFLQDVRAGRLGPRRDQAWRAADRFGADRTHVTVRQPVHRTFYMVACEICCDTPGRPAFDPARVISGGMVVRRAGDQGTGAWQLREGRAVGWRSLQSDDRDRDPDWYRRGRNRGLLRDGSAPAAYSGEQVHPLRATLVEDGARKRTLLFGFLPLGGAVEAEAADAAPSGEVAGGSDRVRATGQLAEFQWPFGSWDGVSEQVDLSCAGPLNETARELCGAFAWRPEDAFQVRRGIPQPALIPWLRALLERFHIHDAGIAENEALRTLLAWVFLYRFREASDVDTLDPARGRARSNLRDYIDEHFEDLLAWYADHERQPSAQPLPGLDERDAVYVPESVAAALREQLVIRSEQAEQWVEAELPLPRYGQAPGDVYFIRPFVRYCDARGCERIAWGPDSEVFRVAGPLDPQASRPSVVALPELRDVKRGVARGVTFLTPKSIADQMEKLSPDLDFEKTGKRNRLQACLGFSISFSIPVITICAMILLMIVLNLLNLVFRWLPWAILKLPRRC